MNITNLMNQITQTLSGTSQEISEVPSKLEESLQKGMEAILGKVSGQSVTGEVLMAKGNEILLSLGENQLLQAKLEGSSAPQKGQMMTFQIRNNANGKVILTPLFENLNQNPSIANALKSAGMPLTDTLLDMVKSMMEEGLPVDKQSLYQMNKAINMNPGVPPTTLAQMQRLGISLEPEMVTQFQNYQNYEHQITNSIPELVDAFSESISQLLMEQGFDEGIFFAKEVLGELLQIEEQPEAATNQQVQLPVFTQEEQKNFAGNLIKLGVSEEEVTNLMKQNDQPAKLLKETLKMIFQEEPVLKEHPEGKEELSRFFEGKEFKQLLKGELNKQLLLEPLEVAEDGKVEKLYEKMNEQIGKLNDILSQSAKQDTSLAKVVTNMNQNIDFMNQLNQTFSYVQIPLKMYHKEASGELFVYTNKKSLAGKDGNVSALLHLDMEHLGSVDVHVTLNKGQKVSTKFYLEDDASLDLISENIDMLNRRLEKRGYSMNAEFINREEQTNVMQEILEQSKNISVLSGYSFDARA